MNEQEKKEITQEDAAVAVAETPAEEAAVTAEQEEAPLSAEQIKLRKKEAKKAAREQKKRDKAERGGGVGRIIKRVIIILVLLFIAGYIYYAVRYVAPAAQSMMQAGGQTLMTESVERRSITHTLTGKGTLEPADSYIVGSMVTGEILSAPFEEGDLVAKDDVLYQIDTTDVQSSIERSELSLQQSQLSYNQMVDSLDDLILTANGSGTLISLDVEEGDTITAGQVIGQLRDSGTMKIKIPFNADDAAGIFVGQAATLTLDGNFEQIQGVVSEVSTIDEVLDGYIPVRYITISVNNPGGITEGMAATAVIGDAACSAGGTFEYNETKTLIAENGGKVVSVYISKGDWVSDGEVIVALENEAIDDQIESGALSLRSSELMLKEQRDQLEDYVITSPISGTIIEKNAKEGDKLSSLTTSNSLCTIFDISYLKMEMLVDELDISDVWVGQKVVIHCDAVEGEEYVGEVTRININGTSSGGVTAYPITVRIDETDGLLPGMNVDAEIIVEEREDVLAVPVSAVARGNVVLTGRQTDAGKAAAEAAGETVEEIEAEVTEVKKSAFDTVFEGILGLIGVQIPEATETDAQIVERDYIEAPVELGIADSEYIEITGGLDEGDNIAYYVDSYQGSNIYEQMMG